MSGDSLWCDICWYGDLLSSVRNLLKQKYPFWQQTEALLQIIISGRVIIIKETVILLIIIHTTAGNSSLTSVMIRDVFPTLAVYTGNTRVVTESLSPHINLINLEIFNISQAILIYISVVKSFYNML